jgi:hypothetical protein
MNPVDGDGDKDEDKDGDEEEKRCQEGNWPVDQMKQMVL